MQPNIVVDGVDTPDVAPELGDDFSGLGLIDFYLYVHYGHNYFGDDDEFFQNHYAKLNVIKIADNQAVTVLGDKVSIVTAPLTEIPTLPK